MPISSWNEIFWKTWSHKINQRRKCRIKWRMGGETFSWLRFWYFLPRNLKQTKIELIKNMVDLFLKYKLWANWWGRKYEKNSLIYNSWLYFLLSSWSRNSSLFFQTNANNFCNSIISSLTGFFSFVIEKWILLKNIKYQIFYHLDLLSNFFFRF